MITYAPLIQGSNNSIDPDFLMTVTSLIEPMFLAEGGAINTIDNNDGTWDIAGFGVTRVTPDRDNPNNGNITEIEVKLTSSLTSMYGMFWTTLPGELNILQNVHTIIFNETVDTSNVTRLGYCFRGLPLLNNLDLTNMNTNNVTDFSAMFWETPLSGTFIIPNNFVNPLNNQIFLILNNMFSHTNFSTIDVSGYNFGTTLSISSMFLDTRIESLDLSAWDVSNIETMMYTFSGSINLAELNVSTWDTSSLTSIAAFAEKTALSHLDLSSFTFNLTTSFNFMLADCPKLECITNLDTTNVTSAENLIFNNSTNIINPDAAAIALLQSEEGYNWTNPEACPSEPPVYLLTEPLETATYELQTYWYVVNSSASGDVYNGRLEHTGDGNKAEGAPWEPGTDLYPQTGVIDLTIQGDGDGSRRIMTGWIPSSTKEWDIFGIYNLVLNVGYDAYVLDYKGNDLMDIYLGDQDTDFSLMTEPTYANVPYAPDGTEWVITENAPDIINISNLVYNMDSFPTKP